MSELISSPWLNSFQEIVKEASGELFLVAPYITPWPLSWVRDKLTDGTQSQTKVCLITDFNVGSLQGGSLSASAIQDFAKALPDAEIIHVPRLHTKIYLNERAAIITSANMTAAGILHNVECGVKLTSRTGIKQTKLLVTDYLNIGSPVTADGLDSIVEYVGELKTIALKYKNNTSAQRNINKMLYAQQEALTTQILSIRVQNESVESIFKRTIMVVLRKYGPLPTVAIQQFVANIQPDLCDESVDRLINGVSFGKKWKHQVRSAQVALKRKGMVININRLWHIVE